MTNVGDKTQQDRIMAAIDDAVRDINDDSVLWVAYSGGLDSHVLLHALTRVVPAKNLRAIHINHGISPFSDQWQAHCEQACADFGIQCDGVTIPWVAPEQNLEAQAREARYRIFESFVNTGDLLFMGHHLDDQIETFFLRLMRGAGIDGLSGMPKSRALGAGTLVRPFLEIHRAQLEDYAAAYRLDSITDESNLDNQYDRNFMRNRVLPLLATRWPMYRKPMARTLGLLQGLSDTQSAALSPEMRHRLTEDGGLKTPELSDMPREKAFGLLREWLRHVKATPPSAVQLTAILDELINAQQDAQPEIQVGGGTVRRFKTAVYFTRPFIEIAAEDTVFPESGILDIAGSGRVSLVRQPMVDVKRPLVRADLLPLRVVFGKPGLVTTPVGRAGSRDLKRLMQEYRVKPWIRSRMPLIFHQDQLVAVGDLFVVEGFQAVVGDEGFAVTWQQSLSRSDQ